MAEAIFSVNRDQRIFLYRNPADCDPFASTPCRTALQVLNRRLDIQILMSTLDSVEAY